MEQIRMVPLEQLHPHEQNPRVDAASVTDLVESIREHGIEVPLVAAPPYSGGSGWVVIAGHRRLTAAHELGLSEVPVQIRADLMSKKEQLAFIATENILRDQLTAVEEARLVQDMLDLGMTQAEVAKQTALGKKRVSERVKLAKLAEETGDKVHRGQITVDDALVIAEYSDDPEAAAKLEQAAGTYNFDWEVSSARRRREDRDRAAASRKDATKKGLRVAEAAVALTELVEAGLFSTPAIEEAAAAGQTDPDAWVELLTDEHASCPGHVAVILTSAVRVPVLGALSIGTLVIGCDQHETLHATDGADPTTEPEPEADPWDDISPEDFETARIHREQHLAKTLPTLDLATEALDIAIKGVIEMGWGAYMDDARGIGLLQAITGVEGKTKVAKALRTWPLDVLLWIGANDYALRSHHAFMAEGKQGSTYWAKDGALRQLLERTGYAWSEPEQRAILLATGIPHDATDDEGAGGEALAEGGEAA